MRILQRGKSIERKGANIMQLYNQANGKLTETDRLQLATLLLKAGYTVAIKKINVEGKPMMILEVTV